ncbi:TetR/AcrR family transcriptional regulator [Halalkalibacterium halodurans]|uniref:Transcriptional regulator (TetR/AcrR family) n=2 Tax=Halalkalibacterium halodurans (strain ATCC BAA-125 / DSM 18197 / FERM 7344 / JCM 9153 / C-125) TaxID=272558 RepID=Q9K8A4_HALH5|nr:TetR/AcrR family transcriptional regulator [Halalkalibacterium halodurans]MDY7223642.1 TetR/AcrR family transcriptional regulator [Halalkalibacterium halodurans]MDY7242863.1 TetR/AcrR family transcriptional regulator [Halalkalibacterium halodurans]MED4082085.1 TetR/AcrR family transcriptional regulator C-terminal domain-containing protein [Halalkalibacterium halodurans]MED4124848.1 TetR/AcrR family transcriptional regulator C-terminal domain-containing protein [Halalkalibacterium halodurans]
MGKKKGPKYDQIIDAAVQVIAEHGYHQAQVSKIAKAAGVADGTIYLYFNNKEDVLISLFQEKMGRFVDKIRSQMNEATDVEEKLKILVNMHFKQLAADHKLAIVTQLELRQSNTELRLKINEVLKGYLNLLDELLMEGKEKGYFFQELDTRLARQMIFGTLDEVVTNWVMKDCKYDLTALVKPVHQLLLGGLRHR